MSNQTQQSRRLQQQLAFIVEIDHLKQVLRRSTLMAGNRRENTAEHSWHIAVMALLLQEHAAEPVDLLHVLKLLLVHDIVEIDAGDTFAYDTGGYESKLARETQAAERIFGLLPAEQRDEFRALWEEFDACASGDARYANMVDRLMPTLHNLHNDGGTWRESGVSLAAVVHRLHPIEEGSPFIWATIREQIDHAVELGQIQR